MMKPLFLAIACLLCFGGAFAQTLIKFDQTEHYYGQVYQGDYLVTEFWFTNVGPEDLIIESAKTGDGGFYADTQTEKVAPGERSFIRSTYNISRMGQFNKSVSVAVRSGEKREVIVLYVRGEVVHRETSIQVSAMELTLDDLKWGAADTVTFSITNVGTEPLHIFPPRIQTMPDIFTIHMAVLSDSVKRSRSWYNVYPPGEKVEVTLVIRNIFGKVGTFERKLCFGYNSHDTLEVTVKGRYSGVPPRDIVYESDKVLHYAQGKLTKVSVFNGIGEMTAEMHFEGIECVYLKELEAYPNKVRESFFKNGKLVRKETQKLSH